MWRGHRLCSDPELRQPSGKGPEQQHELRAGGGGGSGGGDGGVDGLRCFVNG